MSCSSHLPELELCIVCWGDPGHKTTQIPVIDGVPDSGLNTTGKNVNDVTVIVPQWMNFNSADMILYWNQNTI